MACPFQVCGILEICDHQIGLVARTFDWTGSRVNSVIARTLRFPQGSMGIALKVDASKELSDQSNVSDRPGNRLKARSLVTRVNWPARAKAAR